MPDPIEYNIDEVVALDPTDTTTFTEGHKQYLEANKDQLTTDELIKFGFQVETPKPVSRNPSVTPEAKGDTGSAPVDDEDKKAIRAEVEGYMSPIIKQQQEQQDRIEVDTFLAANPDYVKYKAAIVEHIKDPAYSKIPVDRIAKMIASDDLMKIGARKEREAQAKAKATQGGGTSARQPQGAQKDWGGESKEAFEAKRAEVLSQR